MMKVFLKVIFVILFLSLLTVHPAPSYAWWRDREVIVVSGPGPYYYPYHAYPAYPIYAVASADFQPVVVNGTTYYVNNGVYYIYTQYGYESVATPAGTPSVQSAAMTAPLPASNTGDSITINVPNDKGGYNPVVLKKSGSGYVGPQGEFYPQVPSIDQLKVMYGK